MATLAEYEARFPWIAWREPMRVTVPGLASGLACRLCIARHGLRGTEVAALPQTAEQFAAHWREAHGGEAGYPSRSGTG